MKNKIAVLVMILVASSCSNLQKAPVAAPVNPLAQGAPITKSESPVKLAFKNRIKGFTCKRDKEIRSVWVDADIPHGCKLWYSNHRGGGPTAWSRNGNSYCLKVSENIVHNLVLANYTCTQD